MTLRLKKLDEVRRTDCEVSPWLIGKPAFSGRLHSAEYGRKIYHLLFNLLSARSGVKK
jgi:hypothetical protein